MRATGAMKVQRQVEGGEGREGRESDVAHRQELARLTHDHTHAQVGIHINMFYNLFKIFTSLPHTL